MITDTDRAAIEQHYKYPVLQSEQAYEEAANCVTLLYVRLDKIKAILEAAQKKAAQQPHVANHFAYRENVYKMAIEAVMKELQ